MKLKSLTLKVTPKLPGISAGALTTIDIDNPAQPLRGWNVIVRGPSVMLVSPPGWTNATATTPTQRDPKGPCVMFVIPMSDVYLQWLADEAELEQVLKGNVNHRTGPIGPQPVVVPDDTKALLSQIPPGQMGDA